MCQFFFRDCTLLPIISCSPWYPQQFHVALTSFALWEKNHLEGSGYQEVWRWWHYWVEYQRRWKVLYTTWVVCKIEYQGRHEYPVVKATQSAGWPDFANVLPYDMYCTWLWKPTKNEWQAIFMLPYIMSLFFVLYPYFTSFHSFFIVYRRLHSLSLSLFTIPRNSISESCMSVAYVWPFYEVARL